MRVGILQTGSVLEHYRPRHGDYPAMIRTVLARAASNEVLEFEDYDVTRATLPGDVDECDAYVITGSRDSVYDGHDWIVGLSEFVGELHERRRKVVGICFGHQLIAQALGGAAGPAPCGWTVGVHESRVAARTRWMDPEAPSFSLISAHQDQVSRLPAGAQLIATNDVCPNAAFQVGEHMLAFQGHPEFTKAYSRDLMSSRRELLGEKCYREGMASLAHDTDEGLVARWILNFMVP